MIEISEMLQHGRIAGIALGANESDVQRAWGEPAMKTSLGSKANLTLWNFGAVEATFDKAGIVKMLEIFLDRPDWPAALDDFRNRRAEISSRAQIAARCEQSGVPFRPIPALTFGDQFGEKAGPLVTVVGTASTGRVEKLIIGE